MCIFQASEWLSKAKVEYILEYIEDSKVKTMTCVNSILRQPFKHCQNTVNKITEQRDVLDHVNTK